MNFGFDTANTAPARSSFDPLKPGWYAARIVGADIVEGQKATTGQMLKLTFEIIAEAMGQQCVGRKVFANLCHQHENKQTREIAQSQIVTILDAIGKHGATSADVMLGCELQIKLSTRPADGQYDARNEVKGFKPLSEGEAPAAGAAKPAAAPAASRPAWGAKKG